jgi:hypothetical protein
LVGSGGGSGATFSGSGTIGFAARGGDAGNRAGGLPPGRCDCGRSAAEPR